MIPKIIHYCWFGRNPLPELALRCIESWKKFLPDYEIKEWNEDNFDVNIIPYTAQAYKAKKYAFVSDYARFWILYQYGGVYFDTDVEVIKPMEEFIKQGSFMGCENGADGGGLRVAPGLGLGVESGSELYKEILDKYASFSFYNSDGSMNITTVVQYVTGILKNRGLKESPDIQIVSGCHIYPKDYLCPKSYEDGKIYLTDNTYCIHHFADSWNPWYVNLEGTIWRFLGCTPHRYSYHLVEFLKKPFRGKKHANNNNNL